MPPTIILPGSTEKQRRAVLDAIHDPHDARERMHPDFKLLTHCSRCGKTDLVPRRFIHEANRVHVEECGARQTAADDPIIIRVFYPKQT
jgi:hypothetical protein